MKNIQYESDNFVVCSPDNLKYITNPMMNILEKSSEFYKMLFDINDYRKIQLNFFDDKNDFREFIYKLRGERKTLPVYSAGTFDRGMINLYIQPNIDLNTPLYNKKLHAASHELFHIMYKELILEKEKLYRIIWFDEGMAQLFSGENDVNFSEKNFKSWFKDVLNTTKKVPNLNDIDHSNRFETPEYSGYKLSVLAVKYLYESLGLTEFKELMHDDEKIKEYGKNITIDAMRHYKNNLEKDEITR